MEEKRTLSLHSVKRPRKANNALYMLWKSWRNALVLWLTQILKTVRLKKLKGMQSMSMECHMKRVPFLYKMVKKVQGVPRTKLCWVPHWGSLTAGNQASATLDICTPLKQIKKLPVSLESQWHFNSAMLSNHSENFSNNIWALFYIHWFQQPIKSFFLLFSPNCGAWSQAICPKICVKYCFQIVPGVVHTSKCIWKQ